MFYNRGNQTYFRPTETARGSVEVHLKNSTRKMNKPIATIVQNAALYPERRCPSVSIRYSLWAHYNNEPEMALPLARQALATAKQLVAESEQLLEQLSSNKTSRTH